MRYEIDGGILTDIADAIREKTGKSALITPEDMAGEIDGISGAGNLLNYYAWKNCPITNGNATFASDGTVTLNATSNDAYTQFNPSNFPEAARIPVKANQTVTMTWNVSGAYGLVYLFQDGGTEVRISAANTTGTISLTATKNGYITFRIGVQVNGTTAVYSDIRIIRSDPT